MTDEKNNNPRSQSSATSLPDPAKIRKQAEQKAKAVTFPDIDTMTREELRHMFQEMKVEQIEAELQNEQLRSQLEQHDSQAELLAAINALSTHLAIINEAGEIIAVNKAWDQFAHLNSAVLSKIGKGVNYFDICDNATGPDVDIAAAFAKGMRAVLDGEKTEFAMEYPCHSNTVQRWFIGRVTRFSTNEKTGLVVAHENITERKQAEVALKDSHELLDATQRLAHVGGWEWYVERQTMTWSDETYRIHGMSPGIPPAGSPEHIDMSLACYDPADRPVIETAFRRCAEEGQPYDMELRLNRTDGRHLWIRTQAQAIQNAGRVVRVTGTIMDITERKRMDNALQESEQRFRQWFESSPISLWEEDFTAVKKRIDEIKESNVGNLASYFRERPKLVWELAEMVRVLDVNQATLKLYRAESKEGFFSGITKIFSRESLEGFLPVLGVIAAGEKDFVTEKEHVTLDGEPLKVQVYWTVAKGHEEDYSRVLVSIVDVTQQKQAEEALHRSENYYRAIFETSGAAMFIIEEDTTISLVNSNFEKLLEYSKQEVEGKKSWTEFVHPEDVEWMKKNHYLRRSDPGAAPLNYEFRFLVRDGGLRHGYLTVDMIPNTTQSVISVIDITERKRAEDALRESEEKFRSTFAASPDSVNINRLEDGLYVDINRGFTRLTGFTREDVIGKTSIEVNIWHDPEDRQKLVRGLRDKGFHENLEARFRRKDGSVAVALMSAAMVHINNEPHIISITREITELKRMQEALHKSEEKHRRLFETMTSGVIHHAADGEIISANPAAERILGFSFDQVKGKTSIDPGWKMIKENGTEVPGTEHPSMIALRTGETVGPVIRGVFNPNKNYYVWLSITAIPLFQPGEKKPFQAYAAFEDITQRLERELEYRQILNTSIDGFWVVDTRGHFLEVNPAAVDLLGYTREEMLGHRISDIEAMESLEEMKQHIKTLKNRGYGKFETQHRHKDGHLLDVEISTTFLAHPQERFVVFTRDISERKQKERENHLNRLRLEILNEINNMPGATEKMINDLILEKMLSLSDSEIGFFGYITDDEEAMEIHSWSDKAMQRCSLQDKPMIFPLQQAGLWGEPIRKRKPLIVNDYSQPHSAKQGFPEGHIQISNFMTIPVFEATSIVAIAAVGNKKWPYDDIDVQQLELLMNQWWEVIRRKRLYKEKNRIETQLNQAQKMESVGRLAGGVAHDFNNKLSVINGFAELAMEMIDPADPLHETIQEIHTAGKKSADIVRQLLAFARKQTISPVLLNLNDTISSMLKMLQRLIGENINLEWHPGNNLWPVKIDPSQVDQVMANLAVNARDAISDVGKLTIETKNTIVDADYCKSLPEAIPGRYVMLAVSDDGCGMEKEVQDFLFEPFFTTKEIGKGTGLGLPTIYGIVKQNKGFINVYSEPGEGTTFKLYLPSREEGTSFLQSAKESTGHTPTGTETILVVEDENTILQMSKQMLERLGYTVETAGTPAEAWQISKQYDGTIHLLLTDVIMPEMNGRDLSSQLIQTHPGVKTLYMSGYTADVIAHHGVIDEGVQFIQKPFSLKDLAVKVREVLEQE